MKAFRIALALSSFALIGPAWADVRTLHPVQHINRPDLNYTSFGQDVAVDDRQMIVLGRYIGGQAALLYSRETSTSPFVYQRALQASSSAGTGEVAMKNGIAVVRLGSQEWFFEFNGSTYVLAATAQTPTHPGGVAISGRRILIGGNGCEYGAVIYEKGAGGVWDITGRIPEQPGSCLPSGFAVELNYDYALLRVPDTNQATAWHRNVGEFNWAPAGTLNIASDAPVSDQPFALQNSTAVATGNYVFRRNGTQWPQAGRALAANYYNTFGIGGFGVVYRDGVLLASEAVTLAQPYAYLETSPGHFDHVAVLDAVDDTVSQDVSKNTVVVGTQSVTANRFAVEVFQLPAPLLAPSPIANDFETLDISGFSFVGGGDPWTLTKRGINDVLRVGGRSAEWAVVNGSDWTGYRRIEADITPTYNGPLGWAGLIVRFIDIGHYYYARVSENKTISIWRHKDGIPDTFISGANFTPTPTVHASFSDDGVQQVLTVNGTTITAAASPSAGNGPAALTVYAAGTDYDNVHVSATERFLLLEKEFTASGNIFGQDFTEHGGTWQMLLDEQSDNAGFAQQNPNGSALATIGTPVENQEVNARIRLDAFNSSNSGAWYGLLARYQDPKNYYSVAVRSSGQIQIRKQVNGVVTVLASANFTAVPGQKHDFKFQSIHDELHLFVDGALVAFARDGAFTTGQYGIATHYAKATWDSVVVFQP